MELTTDELAEQAAQSRRHAKEQKMKPAVRRIFALHNIPTHIQGKPSPRYSAVLSALGKRGADKRKRMERSEHGRQENPVKMVTGSLF